MENNFRKKFQGRPQRDDRPRRRDDQKPRSFGNKRFDREDRPSFKNDRFKDGNRDSFRSNRFENEGFPERREKRFDREDRPSFKSDRFKDGKRGSFKSNRFENEGFSERREKRFDREDRPSFKNDRFKDGNRNSFNSDRKERSFSRERSDFQNRKPFFRSDEQRPRIGKPNKDDETMPYYGIYSCQALSKKRPHDIERVYLIEELLPKFKRLLSNLAKESKPYRVVSEEELVKLTDSTHHEGICIVAKKKQPINLNKVLIDIKESPLIGYLDGVSNPHNIGAIIRTAAHFGMKYLLIPNATALPPSAYRIAREGAEHVSVVSISNPIEDLKLLKKLGFKLIATATKTGKNLKTVKIPSMSIIVLGDESLGVSELVEELADELVTIPGTKRVDSLNVSNAFAICAFHAGFESVDFDDEDDEDFEDGFDDDYAISSNEDALSSTPSV